MKLYFYFISLFIFSLYSCRGPEKLIEKEKYDLVLKRAEPVFNRKKMPSLEWIKSVETAFALANQRDLIIIKNLEKKGGLSSWKKIYFTLRKIDNRQYKINQYPQYTAETGYTASFIFNDTYFKKQEAESRIASIYFVAANKEMENVRKGSKKAALVSIRLLDSALVWRNDIHLARDLRQEAIDSAMVRVALYVHSTQHYNDVAIDIENFLYRDFNQYFKPYLRVKINPEENFKSDYYFFVEPISVFVGSEQESVRETTYSKEVVTGHETKREWNETDSVWVTKTIEIKATVYGTLIEFEQSKDASMQAVFSLENALSRKVYYEKKIGVFESFDNEYSRTEGDSRALSCSSSGFCSSFPSDHSMRKNMSRSMAHQACLFIKKRDWWAE